MSKILVTGGRGFIGSRVVKQLKELGHAVIECGRFFELYHYTEEVDYVIHLAGVSNPGDAARKPFNIEVENEGLKYLVSGARAWGCKKFIYVSSSLAKYPELNAYAKMKSDQEKIVTGYFKEKTVIFRPFSVYGRGMRRDSLLGSFMHDIPEIHGDGRALRDFVHVDDVARALILGFDLPPGTYDVCHEVKRVCYLAWMISPVVRWRRDKVVNPLNLTGDPRPLMAHGWKPEMKLNRWIPAESGNKELTKRWKPTIFPANSGRIRQLEREGRFKETAACNMY